MATCTFHPDRETGRACTRCGKPACADCLRDAPVGAHCRDCVKAATPTLVEALRRDTGRGPAAKAFGATRPRMFISPVFLGIVAAFVGSGVWLWLAGRDPQQLAVFAFVLSGWVFSLCLHEFGHAFAAYVGGDTSVIGKGYLSLDPRRYTDPGLSLLLPLLFLAIGGIGLPGGAVWIETNRIRSNRWRSIMSFAGPFMNLVLGCLLGLPFLLGVFDRATLQAHPNFVSAVSFLMLLQFISVLLNLLPIPGLDGYGVIEPYLPFGFRAAVAPYRGMAFFLLFFLVFRGGPFHDFVFDGADRLLEAFKVEPFTSAVGYELFKFWEPIR